MGARIWRCAGRYHPQNARGEARDRETERFEHRLEERVLLEAIAAAPAGDELCLKRRKIERNGAAEQRVEVFKDDCGRMQRMERAERRKIGGSFALIADAGEIGVGIEHRVVSPRMGLR